MTPKPTKETKATNREAVLAAAIAEGKLVEGSLPAWRKAFDRNPAATQAELRQLVAIDPKVHVGGSAGSATDKESRLLQGTRAALGLTPHSNPRPLATGGALPESQPPVAQHTVHATTENPQLTRTEHGTVLYGGVPTRLSAAGDRQVFQGSDWMMLDEHQRVGFTPSDSAISIYNVQHHGTSEARQTLEAGLPAGTALGVV
jgi:hypothetical protein